MCGQGSANVMTLVSVVIPTYNRANLIRRCVKSVLNQTVSDIEVLVVDDGSSDRTKATLEKIGDERFRYYKHEQNRGGAAARNTGIQHSSGDYIGFLDSDDVWHPTKLKKQLNQLDSKPAEWAACYCDVKRNRGNILIDTLDTVVSRKSGPEGGEELIDDILTRKLDFGGTSTLLVRHDVVSQLDGFDESFQRIQDTEFIIRLLMEWKLTYVDEVLVTKYDTGSVSLNDSIGAVEQFHRSFSELLNRRGLQDVVRKVDYFNLAKAHFSHGQFTDGFDYLLDSKPSHIRDVFGLILALFRGINRNLH
jgi:glycosyltransferase involved in cell wall biosynthesis